MTELRVRKPVSNITIAGVNLRRDTKFGSYYGTTKAEKVNTGKNEFIPSFRAIFVSGEMYPGTDKSFFYITSHIHGKMRLYRHRDWNEADVANIFASGKTLGEAIEKFTHNFSNKIYNNKR